MNGLPTISALLAQLRQTRALSGLPLHCLSVLVACMVFLTGSKAAISQDSIPGTTSPTLPRMSAASSFSSRRKPAMPAAAVNKSDASQSVSSPPRLLQPDPLPEFEFSSGQVRRGVRTSLQDDTVFSSRRTFQSKFQDYPVTSASATDFLDEGDGLPPIVQRPGPGPSVLRDPLPDQDFIPLPEFDQQPDPILQWPVDPPAGYTGPSGISPRDEQENSHFVPMEDRWRIGTPEYDRLGLGHPRMHEYIFRPGYLLDPYHQNVLKGDYPILGQHNFFTLTLTEQQILEGRQVPTPNSPFESTPDPGSEEFFGNPNQFFYVNNMVVSADWLHGDGVFKPADWRVKVTSIFNLNDLNVGELAVVNPDVRQGTSRFRTDYALEEWFGEAKLADFGPDYDFASVRAGSQFFSSDFKGFIFSDTNRGVRLFGTRHANRDQFNLMWFDQTEKDTNSLLNTFNDRHQNTWIANYYRQDFIWPGFNVELSYHYNRDKPSFKFDDNNFLVRPDPAGVAAPHRIDAHYIGFAGEGHINRFNISQAAYYVLGKDSLNPIAGQPQDIHAWMAALEVSYDRDWVRFRSSYFFSSGDSNPNDTEATGFDTIFDNPNFVGGQFSYWQRQQIKLFGVNLVQRMSLVPDLRSSKFQGQSNFVNPGIHISNVGIDADLTPRLKAITNLNFLWFDRTEVLETFVFQSNIRRFVGADLSVGMEYRPLLNNNIIFVGGISTLIPGQGFKDLYDPIIGTTPTFVGSFLDIALVY